MKNLAVTVSLVVLMLVGVAPTEAQQKQRAGARTTAAPPPQPAKTPTTPQPAQMSATRPGAEQAGVIQGKVINLGWGDSLTVLDAQSKQHRVRLLGIDAPEKEQNFGPAARQKLSAMVFGKAVSVKYQKMDRNGRPLGKVLLGTTDVNLEMLKAGLAWYYANDRDLPETDRPLYAGAEREARAAKRGLWQDETASPPWEFRQARKQMTPPASRPAAEPALAVSTETTPENAEAADPDVEPVAEQAEASASGFPKAPKIAITGDNSTRTYYKTGCPDLEKVLPQNRVSFGSIEEAEKAGFKRTPNCP